MFAYSYYNMSMNWSEFLQYGEGRILVIIFFMAVITLSLLIGVVASVFSKGRRFSDSKVLGGLSVLLVAIIADNAWIYFLALFIAGLLIASERFMLLLAAVFNSDRTNVHKIPSYWQEEKSYSEQELVETIEESSGEREIAKDTPDNPEGKDDTSSKDAAEDKRERFKAYIQKISDIESMALSKLRDRTNYKYQLKESVAVKLNDVTIKYDAIFVEPETNTIKGAFEVKYFASMKGANIKAYLGNRARKFLSSEYKVGFIIVFNGYDHGELNQILDTVRAFEDSASNAFVAIYQNEGKKLTPLYEASIKREFPTNIERLFG